MALGRDDGADRIGADLKESGGFDAQSDFGTVDAIDTRVTARSATGCNYVAAGKEAELHKPPAQILCDIERRKDCRLPAAKVP